MLTSGVDKQSFSGLQIEVFSLDFKSNTSFTDHNNLELTVAVPYPPNSLCFRIHHNMRREEMPGVSDVGLRLTMY